MSQRTLIALSALGLVLLGSGTWWWFAHDNATIQKAAIEGASAVLQYDLTDPRKVNLLWQGLTGNTATINVYRSRDNQTWELWKQVQSPEEAGSLSFEADEGENARDYHYYVSVVLSTGQTTVIAPPAPLSPPGTPPPPPGSASSSTSTTPGTTTTTPPSAPPSSPPSAPPATTTTLGTTTTTSTPPTQTVTPPPPGTPYTAYYKPNGQLSGTSSIPLITASFWVRHYGGDIEIGWQNLASSTANVVISRASGSAGPWSVLLRHGNVSGLQSGSVRFLDASLHDDFYYQLEAVSGSNATTTLGPILLEGLP